MKILRSLNGYAIGHPVQQVFWKTVSLLFGPVVLSIVAFLTVVTLWLRGLRRSAILLVTAMIGASLLSSTLKILIASAAGTAASHRPGSRVFLSQRPHVEFHGGDRSGPDRAAAESVLRWRVLLVTGGVLLAAAVGFSRLVLGVHYFSDVLGSWLIGGAWLLILIAGFKQIAATRLSRPYDGNGDPLAPLPASTISEHGHRPAHP